MIPEPQKTYVLELLAALGTAADNFAVAGAQAMKFSVERARGTKDVDFILNVIALRKDPLDLAQLLDSLGYKPVPESRNFQFDKPIPDSTEIMRIEFMAPEEFKCRQDFRVYIQEGVHARACTGGSIALAQTDSHTISGKLPNGTPFTGVAVSKCQELEHHQSMRTGELSIESTHVRGAAVLARRCIQRSVYSRGDICQQRFRAAGQIVPASARSPSRLSPIDVETTSGERLAAQEISSYPEIRIFTGQRLTGRQSLGLAFRRTDHAAAEHTSSTDRCVSRVGFSDYDGVARENAGRPTVSATR